MSLPVPAPQREHLMKSVRLYDIIQAFQAFAGKSLKCTDCADALLGVDIGVIEVSLRKMAKEARRIATEDPQFPDLLRLADEIEKRVGAHS